MLIECENNGDIIRFILPYNVYEELVENLKNLESNLRNGLYGFLNIHRNHLNDNDKPVFFEKILHRDNLSDLLYASMLFRLIQYIINEKFRNLRSDQYEVRLPTKSIGNYMGNHFLCIDPYKK